VDPAPQIIASDPKAGRPRKRLTRRRFLRNAAIGLGAAAVGGTVGFKWFISDATSSAGFPDWLKSRPIAHRGLHDLAAGAPENSLAAFERAVQAGYPIELDVHLLADGAIAVLHDFTLDRMTGVAGKLGHLKAADLAALRLAGTQQRIPLLDEVLELVSGKIPILIEIKSRSRKNRKLEEALDKRLALYSGPIALHSFNPFSLGWFASHRPAIIRGQLASDFRDEDLPWHQKWALRRLLLTRWSRPNFINYDIRCLPYWAVSNKKKLGLPILGWTARSPEEAQRALQYCDNVVFEGFRPPPNLPPQG
jgi:glycerophosphoryl diester phosphodiesterase